MPGTKNLENDSAVQYFISYAAKNNILLGAICAAPSILGHKGLLNGKRATCFPGFEESLAGAVIVSDCPAVVDGNIVTGWGAGGAIDFGLALLRVLRGEDAANKLRNSFRYK